MFGKIKESLYSKLSEYKKAGQEEQLMELFVQYLNIIKESEELTKVHKLYTEFTDFKSTDIDDINEFINESINEADKYRVMWGLDVDNLIEFSKTNGIELKESYQNPIHEGLDGLLYNVNSYSIMEHVSVRDRIAYKKQIREAILENSKEKINPKDLAIYNEIVKQKVTNKLQSLSEAEQKFVIKFLTNDGPDVYNSLIGECVSSIDNKMLVEGIEPQLVEMLSQTKRRLNEMEQSEPTLENMLKVFELSVNLR